MSSMVGGSGYYPDDIVQINTPGVFFEGVGRDKTSFTYNGSGTPSSIFHWYSTYPNKISSGGIEHAAIIGGSGSAIATYALWITSMDSGTWRDLEIQNAANTAWQWDCVAGEGISNFGNNNHLAQTPIHPP